MRLVQPRMAVVAMLTLWTANFASSAALGAGAGTPEGHTHMGHNLLPGEECPVSCESLFIKLQNGIERANNQTVHVQVRGEPKSGTGMVAEWAWGALAHSCLYFQRIYGKNSCRLEFPGRVSNTLVPHRHHSIVFQPDQAIHDDSKPPCTCNSPRKFAAHCPQLKRPTPASIRMEIELSAVLKHMLPVSERCQWSHRRGVGKEKDAVCGRFDGKQVETQSDLWNCVRGVECEMMDERLQLAVLRDPRAVAVSSYFQLARQNIARPDKSEYNNVDDFFTSHLATVCKWISVRYLLFTEVWAERSSVFWYEDAIADPIAWHGQFYAFVGLHLPPHVVEHAAGVAKAGGAILGFPSKGLDHHPEGQDKHPTRTFRDELNEESLAFMDDVVRRWLPPAILRRLGIGEEP